MSLRAEPRRKIGWYLILVGLPALAYLNSLGNPFQYDDFHSIVDNPHIRQLGNIPRFFVDPTLFSVEPGIYLPGEAGVRLEDLVVVTADGCRRITNLRRDVIRLRDRSQ